MDTVVYVISILMWILCPAIIGLILLQGAAGGGGQLDASLGVGAHRKMAQVTGALAVLFFIMVLFMAYPHRGSFQNVKNAPASVPAAKPEAAKPAPAAVPTVLPEAKPEAAKPAEPAAPVVVPEAKPEAAKPAEPAAPVVVPEAKPEAAKPVEPAAPDVPAAAAKPVEPVAPVVTVPTLVPAPAPAEPAKP